ncbi:MAG: hypothetical protein JWQ43_1961 [Glaciihabitans sp.]|nr:hypothetical protein [Glaciihabitans sp.]
MIGEGSVVLGTTVINARVFDGSTLREWTSVRFAGGLITECSVVSAVHDGDEIIDAHGGTLFPGLIDSHVHLVPGALAQSLNFGVTTVLDMFSTPDVARRAREQARSQPDVADVRTSSVGATAPGGHPSALYAPIPTLTAATDADQFVADRVADGADYLKIICGTGSRSPALAPATIAALVSAAHTRGLVVVAHVSSVAGVGVVVAAGVDVVAHVPVDGVMDRSLVQRIAGAGIAVGPTLATIENTLGRRGAAAVLGDPRLSDALGDTSTHQLAESMTGQRNAALPPYSRAEHNVRLLAEAGVTLLAGTDAPNPGTVFGASLHREFELLVRCGVSPVRALAAATGEPARVFGLADRGRIAIGLQADLILVSGDPLTDIAATRGIDRIWRAGMIIERHPFVATDAEAEELDTFNQRVASLVAAVRERRADPRPR